MRNVRGDSMFLFCVLGIGAYLMGCNKLVASMQGDAAATTSAEADASSPSASAATSAAAPAAPSAVTAKVATPAAAGKKPLAAPSPTVDRFPRNRLKDGPCPAGFVEQPGVEEHSSCARACKADADCHGHSCADSDVGDGKVCTNEPSTAKTTKPAANIPACKSDERLWAVSERAAPFCAPDTSCSSDKDCKGKGTCTDAMMLGDNGSPLLTHNGSPMGSKICKPSSGAAPTPVAPTKCAPNQHYDDIDKKCRPLGDCPKGYRWNEPMQSCVMGG